MPPILLKIISLVLIVMAVRAIISGQVMAGSRGLKPHYYSREDSPLMFFVFIALYLGVALLILVTMKSL